MGASEGGMSIRLKTPKVLALKWIWGVPKISGTSIGFGVRVSQYWGYHSGGLGCGIMRIMVFWGLVHMGDGWQRGLGNIT